MTPTPDPVAAAARRAVADAFEVLSGAVRGLDPAQLDARPAGPDTNSIAVLAAHASGSSRLHIALALGMEPPARDRPAEFATKAVSADQILDLLAAAATECVAHLDSATAIDWGATRVWKRPDGTSTEMTAAWALLHGVEHLRGHADEAALTRHVVTGA